MAAELLLVNPRHKRRRRKASGSARRKRRVTVMSRNPRRKRRMSALQRKFFGGRKRRKSSRRRVISMSRNPIRRHRRRRLSIFRRNPSIMSNPVGSVTGMLIPAASGAVGGIAIDYLFSNVSALANLSPMMGNLGRLAAAALLGFGVGKATNKQTGAAVAVGAMTITVYDIASQYLSTSGIGQQYGLGRYSMGRFVRMNGGSMRGIGRVKGMGYWNPARTGAMGRFVNA